MPYMKGTIITGPLDVDVSNGTNIYQDISISDHRIPTDVMSKIILNYDVVSKIIIKKFVITVVMYIKIKKCHIFSENENLCFVTGLHIHIDHSEINIVMNTENLQKCL